MSPSLCENEPSHRIGYSNLSKMSDDKALEAANLYSLAL